MKLQRSHFVVLIVGMLLGMVFMAGSSSETGAAGGALEALPASIDIRVDGQREDIEAYAIKGTTFVRLVDVGKSVDFNVYWDGKAMAVQVESGMPYTGKEPAGAKKDKSVEAIRQDIIARTNELRRKNGREELRVDTKLMAAAQVRAEELAATVTYAHARPDGRHFTTVTDCPYVGENIHRITTYYLTYYHMELAKAAVDDWAKSPDHLENMLNPDIYAIGTGIAKGKNDKGEDCWYCVQMFLVNGCSVNWVDEPVLKK